MKSFDVKLFVGKTCHKHLYKNEITCQTFRNKMALDPMPNELNDLRKQEKISISKRKSLRKQQ